MQDGANAAIFLIGMMGAGKSTIGRLLAQELQVPFVDTDRELEARSGVSIATIFEVEGEAGFRRREAALVEELTQQPNQVLATGGGAILLESNRQHLRERGLVIYLQVSLDEILRRTANDKSRPLLQTADPRARISSLLAEREPLYQQTAHFVFRSAAASPKKLVKRILAEPEVQAALAL